MPSLYSASLAGVAIDSAVQKTYLIGRSIIQKKRTIILCGLHANICFCARVERNVTFSRPCVTTSAELVGLAQVVNPRAILLGILVELTVCLRWAPSEKLKKLTISLHPFSFSVSLSLHTFSHLYRVIVWCRACCVASSLHSEAKACRWLESASSLV